MVFKLFLFSLLATLFMAWRSRKQWDAYHRADVTRVQLTNQISVTVGLGVLTVVLFLVSSVLHI